MARVIVRGVRGNLGVAKAYYGRLSLVLRGMHREVFGRVTSMYRGWEETIKELPLEEVESKSVGDAKRRKVPKELEKELKKILDELGKKWMDRYDLMSEEIAKKYMADAKKSTTAQLLAALREVGFTVKVKTSEKIAEVLQQAVMRNVKLIKTIPATYFDQIHKAVLDSVYKGRDLGTLEEELKRMHKISDNRGRLIAKDQVNKASQDLARADAEDIGVTKGIWQHMRASTKPRPTHELMDGTEFDLAEGCYDPEVDRMIQPGELVLCNCEFKYVIEGIDNSFKYQNKLSKEAMELLV